MHLSATRCVWVSQSVNVAGARETAACVGVGLAFYLSHSLSPLPSRPLSPEWDAGSQKETVRVRGAFGGEQLLSLSLSIATLPLLSPPTPLRLRCCLAAGVAAVSISNFHLRDDRFKDRSSVSAKIYNTLGFPLLLLLFLFCNSRFRLLCFFFVFFLNFFIYIFFFG